MMLPGAAMDIRASRSQPHDPPQIFNYENSLEYQAASARRVMYATWCGAIPLVLLASLCVAGAMIDSQPLMLLTMTALLPAHVVVALGIFLVCMEYGESRARLLPMDDFLWRCRVPIVLLVLNGPAFVGVMILGLAVR
jgi:hypothetical protein